ncbi:MAG: cysteine-rich small domain-containing protein [Ruminococcus bromii]|nr:cysteine-rich small domain-containing protein [Ruminococcus bromii]
MQNSYAYFQNNECEYFPCHEMQGDYFNCLFCFCPLYALGNRCGGRCTYTDKGVKDCSACLLPHSPGGYEYICAKVPEIRALAGQGEADLS